MEDGEGFEEIVIVDDECRQDYNTTDPDYLARIRAIHAEARLAAAHQVELRAEELEIPYKTP